MKSFFKGLGVGLLCLILFVLGVVFNTEFLGLKNQNSNSLEFARDIEVFDEIMPNSYKANLNFNASNELSQKTIISEEEKASIENTFKELSMRIAKENFCKGGSYTLEPNYNYNQDHKTLNGYNLYSNFSCIFSKEKNKDFEAMIKDIYDISSKNSLIVFSTKALQATFDEKILEENKEKLYDLALKKAFEKSEYYSKNLNKICSIKSIDFDTNQALQRLSKLMHANLAFDNTTLPITQNEKQKLLAKVIFECK
ncbi:SIMPL domain-containing protein [Campylobacter sp.]|uniref:SIMPL domain-containing protein n=1 Tax=Campylobacter sp. TaxID=205 RepID=UPI0025C16DA9|nr:SIMPL domain-containing protein [Campylobacter sp.]